MLPVTRKGPLLLVESLQNEMLPVLSLAYQGAPRLGVEQELASVRQQVALLEAHERASAEPCVRVPNYPNLRTAVLEFLRALQPRARLGSD